MTTKKPTRSANKKLAAKAKPRAATAKANGKLASHTFLAAMYADRYFPKPCVDKLKVVFVALWDRIEKERPASLAALYRLTHMATEQINDLQNDFVEHGSEIETGAREIIAREFEAIAAAFDFEADAEEMIATRDW